MWRLKWFGVLLLGAGLGCEPTVSQDLSMSGDLAMTPQPDLAMTAGPDMTMALPDMAMPPPDMVMPSDLASAAQRQNLEVNSAGGRVSSASYQLDFEVGHFVAQEKLTSASYTLEGNAAIKP